MIGDMGDILLPGRDDGPDDVFKKGTVTRARPERVRLDGDINAAAAYPIKTVTVAVGDKVLVLLHKKQMIIIGRLAGGAGTYDILDEDLNTFTQTGMYHQRYNDKATLSKNYPQDRAGLLEVIDATQNIHGATTYVYQRYSRYDGLDVWYRTLYGTGWSPWHVLGRTIDWRPFGGNSYCKPYNASSAPRAAEVNGMIYVNGAMQTTGTTTSGRIGNLPSWAVPDPGMYDPVFLCQGSSTSTWAARVDLSAGTLNFERMNVTTPRAGLWMPFSLSWPAKGMGL